MKRMVVALAVLAMVIPVLAEDEAPAVGVAVGGQGDVKVKAEKKAPVELKELTLDGKITKIESKRKDKEGKEETKIAYALVQADGTQINLREPKAKKGKEGEAAKAIVLADYVDANVTVVAKGTEIDRKGKKTVVVVEIVSITKK